MAGQHTEKGFMMLEGAKIQGDSTDKDHKDQVTVLDVSLAVMQGGKYEEAPKNLITNASDVNVRKYMGHSTPELAQACAKKTPFKKVVIDIPGRLKLTLEKVIVTGVNVSMNVEEDTPTETISLSYRKAQWEYDKGKGEVDLEKA